MSTIGPELPPHLQTKRKRDDEVEDDTSTVRPAKRMSPASSPSTSENKARRIAGPAPPPAPINEMPSDGADVNDNENSSDDDDDYGPAPMSAKSTGADNRNHKPQASAFDLDPTHAASEQEVKKPKRDDWMMMPPKQDDLSRVDPLRPRAKGFATGKTARGTGSGADNTMWTESMEQKQKRLQDEVMGVERPSDSQKDVIGDAKRRAEEKGKARQAQSHLVSCIYMAWF